jgi:simple sugar transport system ATP-binding protein
MPEELLARARAVSKHFGDVRAVERVDLELRAGRIHAVCGENGAGKSTLLKVVAGMLVPDAGTVEIAGEPLRPHTAREAIRRGVAMVLQHFALVPVMTTLENLVLGVEPTVGFAGVLDEARARARASAIATELGVALDLDARVESLGVGDRQRIEIARALFRDARLLILDEPTAVLTKHEAAALYATMRRLAAAGRGIVVVTHKMDEVRDHADVVSVMRRGELVFTEVIDRSSELAAQIDRVTTSIMGRVEVGSEKAERSSRAAAARRRLADGEPLLSLRDVRLGRVLDRITLGVRAGEIVGVAGVEGNGQRELVAVLAGELVPDGGRIDGGPIAVVREDRQIEGLVLDAQLRDNFVLGELDRFRGRLGLLDLGAIEREAKQRLERSGVSPPDLDRPARTLSGGNQQKIVVTRALSRAAKVLVLAQPTRGVDLGAMRDIHREITGAADDGAAVLVVSSDLDELRALASRVVVLARGRIVGELPAAEATDERLGRMMLGLSHEAAV